MNQGFVHFIHLFNKLFRYQDQGLPQRANSNLVCQAVLRKARMFNMTTDRQIRPVQDDAFWSPLIIEYPWIPEANSRSKIRYSCYFVGVFYQLQVTSP